MYLARFQTTSALFSCDRWSSAGEARKDEGQSWHSLQRAFEAEGAMVFAHACRMGHGLKAALQGISLMAHARAPNPAAPLGAGQRGCKGPRSAGPPTRGGLRLL